AQLGGKARTQRDDVHRQPPSFPHLLDLPPKSAGPQLCREKALLCDGRHLRKAAGPLKSGISKNCTAKVQTGEMSMLTTPRNILPFVLPVVAFAAVSLASVDGAGACPEAIYEGGGVCCPC